MRIGVIGLGKVGEVVYRTMMKYHETVGWDKYKEADPLEKVLKSEVIFIAVPTPQGEDGRLDCSAVEEVLDILEQANYEGIAVIKSTVKIGFFDNQTRNLRLVYNPEFLHEQTRWEEFEHPIFVVLAGNSNDLEVMKQVYYWIPKEKFEIVSYREAELLKLVMNAFAAVKISFWNEIKKLCSTRNVDVRRIRDILRKDRKRWTDEYTDPDKGPYGGSCLPKDIKELISYFRDNAILLAATDKVNQKVKEEMTK